MKINGKEIKSTKKFTLDNTERRGKEVVSYILVFFFVEAIIGGCMITELKGLDEPYKIIAIVLSVVISVCLTLWIGSDIQGPPFVYDDDDDDYDDDDYDDDDEEE